MAEPTVAPPSGGRPPPRRRRERSSLARLITALGATAIGMAAIVSLGWWLTSSSRPNMGREVPSPGHRPSGAAVAGTSANIGEFFTSGSGKPAAIPGDWPRFRGARFDGVASGSARLADSWPSSGPRALWSVELGEGTAAPVVQAGRVYILDYDVEQGAEALRCLSLADGKEIWRRSSLISPRRGGGSSRGIPAVADGYVLTVGPAGLVMCVDAVTGGLCWGMDLKVDHGATIPSWQMGQGAVIDRGVAVIALGAEALLMGVDCASGEILWSTPNPGGYGMSQSSVIPMVIAGVHCYVYCALGALVGVSAEEGNRGVLLWEVREWNPRVQATSPVYLGEGRILVTAGQGAGGALVQVDLGHDGLEARVVSRWTPKAGIASELQTPVPWRGSIYAVQTREVRDGGGELVCATADGRLAWRSGKGARFGLGPYLIADGKLYVLGEDGMLTMARAGAARFEQLGRARVLTDRGALAPLCLAGSRLLARDSGHLVCLELGG